MSCAAASAPVLARCGSGAKDAAAGSEEARLRDRLVGSGFVEVEPQPLRTPYEFNGGYRYDEYPMAPGGPRSFVVQECRRIDDVEPAGRLGVLPQFRMLVFALAAPEDTGQSTRLALDLLLSDLGLDPARMVAVTADDHPEPLSDLYAAGLAPDQVVLRRGRDARAAGDGSGFFRPEGHPGQPGFPTVSIHYSRARRSRGRLLSHPLDGDLVEIADIGSRVAGIGLERARWAATGEIPIFGR